jgi:hypothetical protein
MLANKPEQPLTITLDMVAIKEPLPILRYNRPEPELAVDQRQISHVHAIAPEQLDGVEPGLSSPEQQIFELGFAMSVESNDLAVEDCRPGSEFDRSQCPFFDRKWQ